MERGRCNTITIPPYIEETLSSIPEIDRKLLRQELRPLVRACERIEDESQLFEMNTWIKDAYVPFTNAALRNDPDLRKKKERTLNEIMREITAVIEQLKHQETPRQRTRSTAVPAVIDNTHAEVESHLNHVAHTYPLPKGVRRKGGPSGE